MAGSLRSPRTSAKRCSPSCSAALIVALSSCRLAGSPPLSPELAVHARLLRIEDTRRDEPSFIDSLLTSTSADTRAATALTAGRIGARVHLVALRRLATEADTAVAANTLFALVLKDSASAPIAAAALHAHPVVSVEAAFLLGELGERGRAAIVSGIADPTLSSATRGALLLAATRLRPVPAITISPLLTSTDSALAWRAAYVLARGRSTVGARALLSVERSPWAAMREQVARGATKGIAGDSLGDMARATLMHLITDTSARVRVNAIRAFSSYGTPARAAVMTALRDPDAGVRLVAAQSLEQVTDSGATPWTMAFDAETTFAIRRAVADGAIKYGVNLAEHAGWASSDDWHLRAAAAELGARGAAPAALERLVRWNSDADGRVRAAAAGALARLADSASVRVAARTRLRVMLTDADFGVRSASVGGLTRGASADDLAAALTSYFMAASDADNDARLAFWQLADTVIARGSPLPDALERSLRSLARPADPIERLVAARIPRFAAWRDSTGTARPFAWYEDRARDFADTPPKLSIQTDRGTMELLLYSREAPLTTWNIVSLARRGYFDGQRFHRVVPNFVVQGGDPRGDGNGGPGYAIRDEMNRRRYSRGTLGMALSGPNTGGSQFFITHSPQPHLDGGYTVFGELLRGADVLDRIVQGDRIVAVTVH
jgi:cyclophilin family peptidyl-prolyl cis-trans isomerase